MTNNINDSVSEEIIQQREQSLEEIKQLIKQHEQYLSERQELLNTFAEQINIQRQELENILRQKDKQHEYEIEQIEYQYQLQLAKMHDIMTDALHYADAKVKSVIEEFYINEYK